jgi:hypothetical protein
MVAFPIVALADGDVLDPDWIADITAAANNHETRVAALEGVDLTPLWTVQSTTATANIVAETVVATAPSSTYRAHTAYRVDFRFLGRSNTGVSTLNVNMHDTNVAGTARMSFSMPVVNTGNTGLFMQHYLANTTGSDITGRVLVTALQSGTANSVFWNAGSTFPWYVSCITVGIDTDFPQAVAL